MGKVLPSTWDPSLGSEWSKVSSLLTVTETEVREQEGGDIADRPLRVVFNN